MHRFNLASFIISAALLGCAAGCGAAGDVGGASANAPADSRGAQTPQAQANPSDANVNAAAAPAAQASDAAVASTATANPPPKKSVGGAQTAKMPEPQIGSGADDLFLFAKVRGAFEADAELKGSGIIFDAKNGVVVLSGSVADEARKARAEQLARGVEGVKGVRNELRVSRSAAPR